MINNNGLANPYKLLTMNALQGKLLNEMDKHSKRT